MDEREDKLLKTLGAVCGIVEGYHDIWGNYHSTSPATLRALLGAMGVDVTSLPAAEDELRRRERERDGSLCEPLVIVTGDGAQTIEVKLPPGVTAEEVRVRADGGSAPLEIEVSGGSEGAASLRLVRALPTGVHRLQVWLERKEGDLVAETRLAVCPARGYAPPAVADGGRIWGVNFPLYGLRSERNWGIGDFEDLRLAVTWAAELGADLVGLLPLHALFNAEPYGTSPYYPSSRLFLNPIYLAVDRVPEASEQENARFLASPEFRERIERARRGELVEYGAVWALKREALARCHEAFRRLAVSDPASPRVEAFCRWREGQGQALEDFAVFSAVREHLGRERGYGSPWQEWPEELRSPRSEGVSRFRSERAEAVEFQAYLQWLAREQLGWAGQAACNGRMAVGLYLDMALGVDPTGADAWIYQDVLARGASAGCPPDPFSLLGQRWGVPPPIPERHRRSGYAYFLETLEGTAAQTGALRIDHVLALWRLFWVPGELPPSEGAYVAERSEELLGLSRLVSAQNRCLVVGEDLGTIPPEVRTGLMDSGFYSYRVLIFEKGEDGRFRSPEAYPRQALVSVATHDLPSLDGFWTERDIEVKRALARYPHDDAARNEVEGRRWDKRQLLEMLAA
jgi:4-alpha-glucanotransferase